jgi:arylsulfatase A-like enzyme
MMMWDRIAASRLSDRVNRAAKNALIRRRSENFFLYVHYMDVHDYRAGEQEYNATLELLDVAIGDLMQRLTDAKLLEGTTIILTSDHGERFKTEEHFTVGEGWHSGNPAFEEMLRIPLLVSPRISDNDSALMRTEDIFRMIVGLAGAGVSTPGELHPDELYLSEPKYQTYERGPWKSFLRRDDGFHVLIDLESDPQEMTNVADANPEIVAAHADRIAELALKLAAPDEQPVELSEEDKRRLRELGYLE